MENHNSNPDQEKSQETNNLKNSETEAKPISETETKKAKTPKFLIILLVILIGGIVAILVFASQGPARETQVIDNNYSQFTKVIDQHNLKVQENGDLLAEIPDLNEENTTPEVIIQAADNFKSINQDNQETSKVIDESIGLLQEGETDRANTSYTVTKDFFEGLKTEYTSISSGIENIACFLENFANDIKTSNESQAGFDEFLAKTDPGAEDFYKLADIFARYKTVYTNIQQCPQALTTGGEQTSVLNTKLKAYEDILGEMETLLRQAGDELKANETSKLEETAKQIEVKSSELTRVSGESSDAIIASFNEIQAAVEKVQTDNDKLLEAANNFYSTPAN